MNPDFAEPLQQVDRVFVRYRGRKLLYFGGCDYYRLSSDPEILRAILASLRLYGLSTSASRTTTGNHVIYTKVERATAAFFGSPQSVLVSSGYLANIAVAEGLVGEVDRALIDEKAHGSLQNAVRSIGCSVTQFNHRNPADLRQKLRRSHSFSRVVLITDGMFAFDGSLAPLAEYRTALGPEPLIWVDDAHAAGILGEQGQGSIEQAGAARRRTIQTITFSKAFGVYGGAVLCNETFRNRLARTSAVAGNTPLPLPLASAILSALRLPSRSSRVRLRKNVELFWQTFGVSSGGRFSPIVAFQNKSPHVLSGELLRARIYPTFIRYPGGPPNGYFRFALSSEHTIEQVTRLAKVLRNVNASPAFP